MTNESIYFNPQEEGLNLKGFNELMDELKEAERPVNFGRYDTQKSIPTENKSGYINTAQWLQAVAEGYCATPMTKEDLEDLGDMQAVKIRHDNTYNYAGAFTNELHSIELEDDSAVLLYRVHVGLDIRGRYTSWGGFFFDTTGDLEELYVRDVTTVEVTYRDLTNPTDTEAEENYLTISVNGFSEHQNVYNLATGEDMEEFFTLDDKEELKEELEEELEKQLDRKIEVTSIEYLFEIDI